MTGIGRILVMAGWVVVLGCGSSNSEDGGGSEGGTSETGETGSQSQDGSSDSGGVDLPLDERLLPVLQARCEALQLCGCGGTMAQCMEIEGAALYAEQLDAQSEGLHIADVCLPRVIEAYGFEVCDAGVFFAINGCPLFAGDLPADAPCVEGATMLPCADGLWCDLNQIPGVCTGFPGESGGACSSSLDCSIDHGCVEGTCTPLPGPGDVCGTGEGPLCSIFDAYCDETTGLCAALPGPGEPCNELAMPCTVVNICVDGTCSGEALCEL